MWPFAEGGEVDAGSGDPELGEGLERLAVVGHVAPERGDGPGRLVSLGPGAERGGREDGLGSDLEQHLAAELAQRLNALRELYRLAGVPPPVGGVEHRLTGEHLSGAIAEERRSQPEGT